jgi:fibrillarin-like rRNA methylase
LGEISDLEWVKVTGTAEFSTDNGQTRVLLKAESVDTADPPEEAMLY